MTMTTDIWPIDPLTGQFDKTEDRLDMSNAVPEQAARRIATELGEDFDQLPVGPHFEPGFTQEDFLRAATAALPLVGVQSRDDWPKNGVRVVIKDEYGFHRHYYGTELISIDPWPVVADQREVK